MVTFFSEWGEHPKVKVLLILVTLNLFEETPRHISFFYHFSTPKWNRKIETAPHWKPGAYLSCTVKHICNDHLLDKIYHDQYHCPWLLGDLMSISSHGINLCISEYTSLSTRMFKNLALHCLYVHKCVFSRTSSYTHAFYEQVLCKYGKYLSRYYENTKQTKTNHITLTKKLMYHGQFYGCIFIGIFQPRI